MVEQVGRGDEQDGIFVAAGARCRPPPPDGSCRSHTSLRAAASLRGWRHKSVAALSADCSDCGWVGVSLGRSVRKSGEGLVGEGIEVAERAQAFQALRIGGAVGAAEQLPELRMIDRQIVAHVAQPAADRLATAERADVASLAGSVFDEVGIFSGNVPLSILFSRSFSGRIFLSFLLPAIQHRLDKAPAPGVAFDGDADRFLDPAHRVIRVSASLSVSAISGVSGPILSS